VTEARRKGRLALASKRDAKLCAGPVLRNTLNRNRLPFRFDRREMDKTRSADVIQGTLDLLILQALSVQPLHGWGISDRIRHMSAGAFKVGQGSLYPALHRLDLRGWVTSYWRTTENNRIARYYELTAAGRHALADEVAQWRLYTNAVERVIAAGESSIS
jgi:transcriptional regulator